MKLMPGKLTRRGLLLRSPYAIAVGAFAYGSLFERVHFTVERVTCPVPKPYQHLDGLRIAFMTDFHFDDFGNEKMLYRAVKTINSEAVDLVMLGGDYVSNDPTYLEPLGEILQNLRARLGIYGVMGNHEYHYDSTLAVKILSRRVFGF